MSVFDWCVAGNHAQCVRKFQKWEIVPNRKRGESPTKFQYIDEWVECECVTRSCPCYTKPADRAKKPKNRRKK